MSGLRDPLVGAVEALAGSPERIVLGLDRMVAAMERLGVPRRLPMPVILVAGTNGKGSTVAYLEAVYRAAGWRTAAYTSPHLWRFEERLRLGGRWVEGSIWLKALERLESVAEAVPLTFFELSTLAAAMILMEERPDVAILEVGLGGRLDAVNAFMPDLSLIVTVDLDHRQWLGDSRDAIGREKAGILRPAVPAVLSDPRPCAAVEETAVRLGAPLWRYGRDFQATPKEGGWQWRAGDAVAELPLPALDGEHQLCNAAGAAAAVFLLRDRLPVAGEALAAGIGAARVAGRAETLRPWGAGGARLLADVAHNPQAAGALARHLRKSKGTAGRCHAVVGLLADKDAEHTLEPLVPLVDGWHCTDLPDVPRDGSAARLAAVLSALGTPPPTMHDSVMAAVAAAVRESGPDDWVVVFGSFHVVGALPAFWFVQTGEGAHDWRNG